MAAAFAHHVAADPGAPAFHDQAGGWVSRGELEERSARLAGVLAAAGLGPGDRLLFSAGTSVALVVVQLAGLRSGITLVPANPALTEPELARLVADARPKAAYVDDAARRRLLAASGEGNRVAVFSAEDELAGGPAPELDRQQPGDPALLVYTSGTTGRPKAVVLSHGNLLANAEAITTAWRWTPEDRLVLALPLFHVHGLGNGVCGTLVSGGSAVLRPGFAADDVLAAVESERASMFFGVPTMLFRLVAAPGVGVLTRLRLLVSGSAPLPASLHGEVAERTGQVVLERYGMTETLMITSNPYDGERRPGTVGFPLPGVEVRLDDGEIHVRGPNVFAGYLDDPAANEAAFDGPWFRTGDMGEIDADGYVSIVGRRKELIISGGFNVYPREVEDVLLAHPAVAEVAVAGVSSDEWGEVVTAFVVAAPGEAGAPAAEELIEWCGARLTRYKTPRVVHLVDSLPRNALGKVVRSELRP